jgi:surfeit locus 1 family protein
MRHAQWEQFERAASIPLPSGSRGVESVPRFSRVTVSGKLDAGRQILLDNRVQDGVAGYDVLTPLELASHRLLLIDRGWVPFAGVRSRLPNIAIDALPFVTVTGRIDNLPVAGLAMGHAPPVLTDPWPKITSFPTVEELEAAYGRPIERRLLLLDPDQPYGYLRQWEPPGIAPQRHWAYAYQWWSFAILAAVVWFYMALR